MANLVNFACSTDFSLCDVVCAGELPSSGYTQHITQQVAWSHHREQNSDTLFSNMHKHGIHCVNYMFIKCAPKNAFKYFQHPKLEKNEGRENEKLQSLQYYYDYCFT